MKVNLLHTPTASVPILHALTTPGAQVLSMFFVPSKYFDKKMGAVVLAAALGPPGWRGWRTPWRTPTTGPAGGGLSPSARAIPVRRDGEGGRVRVAWKPMEALGLKPAGERGVGGRIRPQRSVGPAPSHRAPQGFPPLWLLRRLSRPAAPPPAAGVGESADELLAKGRALEERLAADDRRLREKDGTLEELTPIPTGLVSHPGVQRGHCDPSRIPVRVVLNFTFLEPRTRARSSVSHVGPGGGGWVRVGPGGCPRCRRRGCRRRRRRTGTGRRSWPGGSASTSTP